jgi:thiazole/oxazole-forming peptide maturase SagD family component
LVLSLLDLHSKSGAEILAEVRASASAEIAAIAGRLARVFTINSPFAPGWRGVGAEVSLDDDQAGALGAARASATGNGESVEAALLSCLAEAADLLSQVERAGDIAATAPVDELPRTGAGGWFADLVADTRQPIDWLQAHDAVSGAAVLVPADLCLRRSPARRSFQPPAPLSAGSAAGRTLEMAATRAVLELCERDAAALWWHGGRRARRFPPEHETSKEAAQTIARLRQGSRARKTAILDITTDLDVPVIAAVSIGHDGRDLACGLAARLDGADAARAAVLEMCQMELAAPIAAAKRAEAGPAALSAADRRHLKRASAFAGDCELLVPAGVSTLKSFGAAADPFGDLIGRLSNHGIPVFLLDLTRADLGVTVVRAVSPMLQPFTAAVSTERFRQALRQSKGVEAGTKCIPLM